MKTAISIPDNVYNAAEQLARRLGESRSELYSKAVTSYIKKHQNEKVTEKLNEIYSCEASDLHPTLKTLQGQSLHRNNEW